MAQQVFSDDAEATEHARSVAVAPVAARIAAAKPSGVAQREPRIGDVLWYWKWNPGGRPYPVPAMVVGEGVVAGTFNVNVHELNLVTGEFGVPLGDPDGQQVGHLTWPK
ncbi:MAG TPA: hypothetical protein PJ982_17060 [Lacipirellulaceae bacterium]|nr:hypothetical protein [Lacipirellulaceae bacterium]